MKKRIIFSFCLLLFLSIPLPIFAQLKTDPDPAGKHPYRYVAPIITPDDLLNVYPQSANYWAGTCDASTKTQVSLVNGVNTELGWMVFDVSGIPDGATINAITFNGYIYATIWPYWSVTPMSGVNPVSDGAAAIYTQVSNNYQQGVAYSYNTESSSFTTGWITRPFEPQAFPDLQVALAQNWFAIGIVEWDFSTSYYIEFNGWAETGFEPYLEVDYTQPLLHDVGVQSVDVPTLVGVGTVVPKATIMCQSTISETFDVTMTISPGGYSSTETVTGLPPAGTIQVSFDDWTAVVGTYTIEVCTQLAGDPNSSNDCMSKVVEVLNSFPGYGYNAYDQTGTYPLGTVAFFSQSPGTMTWTGGTVTDFMCAGTFDHYTQTWYGYQYPGTNFYAIDPFTGGMTLLGSGGNGNMRGLAWDIITNQLYGVDGTSLYAVDESNGAITMVGFSGAYDFIALACSPYGQLYGFDMTGNALIYINKTTGAGTLVGTFPFDVTYAQSADYGLCNNVLYWAAWDASSSEGRFYIVDPSNAELTMIGYLGTSPGLELDAMVVNDCWIPVELTSFTADVNENNVTLNWSTATETNNQGFEVQRSKSGGEYETVTFVTGKGTTTEMQFYSYTDIGLSEGVYTYRLKQVDYDGTFEYSEAILVEVVIPEVYSLNQNYPNPFNPSTRIDFSLAEDSKVTLKVYDLLGQEVVTLLNSDLVAGVHYVNFDAASLNSGVYIYKINAEGVEGSHFVDIKKMILLK